MKSKNDIAVDHFRSGLNCAQSVLLAFAGDVGISPETAKGIACGFGAGMARLQETCGAVTGAFMVLGLYHCTGKPNGKEAAYAAIRSFESRFRDHFGSTRCIDLVQCDLNTEKGKELYHTGELHERVCEKCIGAAVEVVEEMMFLKGGVRS